MWQGVEGAWLLARRDEELARSFRSRWDEHGGLDFDETLRLHTSSNCRIDGGSNAQVLLHAFAPKVEVPILETNVLVDVVGTSVDRERRRFGRSQNLDTTLPDFHLTRCQVAVDRSLGTGTNDSGHAHHVFATNVDTVVDDALHDSAVVPDVDECEFVAVLATLGNPTTQRDRLADVRRAHLTAHHRAQGGAGRVDAHD